jgi:hypothetical protein
VNKNFFIVKTDTFTYFVPIIIEKEKSKMTADKINTSMLIEIPRGSRNKYEYDLK